MNTQEHPTHYMTDAEARRWAINTADQAIFNLHYTSFQTVNDVRKKVVEDGPFPLSHYVCQQPPTTPIQAAFRRALDDREEDYR